MNNYSNRNLVEDRARSAQSQVDDSVPNALFVRHLPDGCARDHLIRLFSHCGTVTKCDVENKYGIVHMSTPEEAEIAISRLNCYDLMGSISVERLKSKFHPKLGAQSQARGEANRSPHNHSAQSQIDDSVPNALFVRHLPDGCTTDHLVRLFSRCGTVTQCDVKNKYGFVYMSTSEEAEIAISHLNFYDLMGSISVERLKRLQPKPGPPGQASGETNPSPHNHSAQTDDSVPKTKLFVGHLPFGCKSDDLFKLFSSHGTVTECDVINKYGFVHMSTPEEAERAIFHLNNHVLMGSPISVERSKSKLHPTPGAPGRARGELHRSPDNRRQREVSPRNGVLQHANPRMNSQASLRVSSQVNPRVNSQVNPQINSQANPQINSEANSQVNPADYGEFQLFGPPTNGLHFVRSEQPSTARFATDFQRQTVVAPAVTPHCTFPTSHLTSQPGPFYANTVYQRLMSTDTANIYSSQSLQRHIESILSQNRSQNPMDVPNSSFY